MNNFFKFFFKIKIKIIAKKIIYVFIEIKKYNTIQTNQSINRII